MTLSQQVTSLDLSKRLKELGVPQESLFYWEQYTNGEPHLTTYEFEVNWASIPKGKPKKYSAFTVAELGEMLPKNYHWASGNETKRETQYTEDGKELVEKKTVGFVECAIYGSDFGGWHYEHDEDNNEASARAKMLIHLLENNLIKL